MRRSDFHFNLPAELIAQQPAQQRRDSRLLCLNGATGALADRRFAELPDLLQPGDLLVLNDTRVIPARLHGHKASGGKVEVLVERVLDQQRVLAHVRASKSPRKGSKIIVTESIEAQVLGREGELFELLFTDSTAPHRSVLELLDAIGHMPLPPYIQRDDAAADRERYQTVYAQKAGAVAAPTAGLHFDEAMLQQLEQQGIKLGYVTLHVGAGTFQPVRVDNIQEHKMHAEWIDVSPGLCDKVKQTKAAGGRVIAVGTTSVRCLETAARDGKLTPYTGDTDIFITPGFHFNIVDAMITNFHLPESTLLMLVSAFAGYEHVMHAYQHAVEQRYRFFSYGDAMFLTKNKG